MESPRISLTVSLHNPTPNVFPRVFQHGNQPAETSHGSPFQGIQLNAPNNSWKCTDR
jgi:hypothetical protein